jgi:hypothetical protein
MRDLYRAIDKAIELKHMVRFAAWPGGARSLGIYIDEDQYLYDGTIEEIESAVRKDLPHLLTPKPSKLPPLPGLPRL